MWVLTDLTEKAEQQLKDQGWLVTSASREIEVVASFQSSDCMAHILFEQYEDAENYGSAHYMVVAQGLVPGEPRDHYTTTPFLAPEIFNYIKTLK